MKRTLIELGQDMLVILINHLVLMGFAVTIMGLFNQENPDLLLWAALGILPAALYFARMELGNFFLFFAIHLLIPVIMLFLPAAILQKVIMMAIVIVYIVWSINIRLKAKTDGENIFAPIFAIGVLGAMALIENFFSKRGWEGYYLLLAIFYIAGYFVYCFISRYLRFLIVNESSAANIPEQEIFTSGMKQTLLFMAGGVVVLFMTANIGWVSYIMSWIGKGLIVLLRAIFSRISYEEAEEVGPVGMESVQQDMGIFTEDAETYILWIILEKIVLVLVAAVLIASIVLVVVMGFRYLWRYFHMHEKAEAKKLQNGVDIRESCTIEKNKRETARWFSFLNNREKVRKAYRKQVLKNKNAIIGDLNTEDLEYMTAKECCDKISAGNLKIIYEKARYSAEDITSEDVKLVKAAGK